ncbi:ATP-binding protein [Campylobacter geochelonis]|uniref:Phosphoribosylaminoimidazole carboxylase n=1 Tax=Campylobacter geochelonis TaxID=1780362 RepID=A0A128EJX8_9BACT|nr:ATP-binding protein [Campylobacter geochelonis]QKF71246.1 ATP-binding protein (AAA domain) [Campylobacter geochelonis]CZE49184.1 phosphoribosylaminoimidazole carboxylase [Campylobacter geochelonis]
MSNNYTLIKDIFVETDKITDFVNLDKSTLAYHKILSALQKPLKLILFYGKPGCGKTFLLNKIKQDLEKKLTVVFFPQPFFDEKEFFNELYIQIFGKKSRYKIENYESFMRLYKVAIETASSPVKPTDQVVMLLDEAQLYPPNLIEKIRLMADSRLFKFLFTVHKTNEEDALAKDYFKTRIWSSIELPNSTLSELKLYIEKKLIFHDFHQYFYMYNDSNFDLLYHLTDGNLRNLNKILYKTYELCEYYEVNRPTEISASNLNNKLIEMAAINAGLINA